MKAFVAAALLLVAVPSIAQETSDAARIAALEARIKALEQQVQRLTVLLDAATRQRAAAAQQRAAEPTDQQAQASSQVDAPPVLVIQPSTETIRNEIRFQCMQQQTYQHAIGGPEPNFNNC